MVVVAVVAVQQFQLVRLVVHHYLVEEEVDVVVER